MHRKIAILSTITMLAWTLPVSAQSAANRRPVLTSPIDDTKLHTLTGNTRPEANAANDRGVVPDNLTMDHLLLQLQRSPELQKAADQFTEDLQNPKSPSYHHWLVCCRIRAAVRFGPAGPLHHYELASVAWLHSEFSLYQRPDD